MRTGRSELETVLVRGATASFAVRAAGMALQLLLHWILVRWLGTTQYGIVAYLLVWSQVLVLFARLGLDTALVRFVAQYRVEARWNLFRGLLQRAWQLVACSGALLGALVVVVALVIRDSLSPQEFQAVLWMSALVLTGALLGIPTGALRGLRYVVRSQLPEQVLRPVVTLVAVGFVLLLAKIVGQEVVPEAPLGVLLLVLGSLSAWVVAVFWQSSAVPPEVSRAKPVYDLGRWWREARSLLLVSGLSPLLNQVDVLVIGILVGRTEVGLYFLATRLTGLIPFGLTAGNTIAAPLISELHAQKKTLELQRIVSLSVWGASLIALILAVLLLALGGPLLEFFDPSYGHGLAVLWIMALGQLVSAGTGPVGYLLNMTGNARISARIMSVTVVLNLIFNVPAVYLFGLEGAAAVTSILIALKNLWTWWEVRRRLGINSSIFAPVSGDPLGSIGGLRLLLDSFGGKDVPPAAASAPLPNLVIGGAQRSGTTSLHYMLAQHPDIYLPPKPQEIHFFDIDAHYARGLDWYRSLFQGWNGERIVAQTSPLYLFEPRVPARLYAVLPEAHLLFILRHPVDRAYSHYWHQRRYGFETLSFEQALEREAERMDQGNRDRRNFSYLARGDYAHQIQRYFEIFEREQILIVLQDDLEQQPRTLMEQVWRFLDLEPEPLAEPQHRNAALEPRLPILQRFFLPLRERLPRLVALVDRVNLRSLTYPPMRAETRERLNRYFAPKIDELEALTGLDLDRWRRKA